jgi:hypothetical protein
MFAQFLESSTALASDNRAGSISGKVPAITPNKDAVASTISLIPQMPCFRKTRSGWGGAPALPSGAPEIADQYAVFNHNHVPTTFPKGTKPSQGPRTEYDSPPYK